MIPLTIDDRYEAMPWDAIDTVVFDVGNVLLRFDPAQILRDTIPERPDLHERLMTKVFRSPYWVMMDHGLCEPPEAAKAMTGRDLELEPFILRATTGWVEMKDAVDEGILALKACAEHGKRLIVLSNYGNSTFSVIEKKYAFFREFAGLVVSSRIGLLKPDPEIYHYVERTYGIVPGRTLFIDDSPQNVEMALHLGWQSLCLNEPGKLARFIGFSMSDQKHDA